MILGFLTGHDHMPGFLFSSHWHASFVEVKTLFIIKLKELNVWRLDFLPLQFYFKYFCNLKIEFYKI